MYACKGIRRTEYRLTQLAVLVEELNEEACSVQVLGVGAFLCYLSELEMIVSNS